MTHAAVGFSMKLAAVFISATVTLRQRQITASGSLRSGSVKDGAV